MFGRTKTDDHVTRAREADSLASDAMSLFESAVTGLEVAAQAHLSVVADTDAEIARLVTIRDTSKVSAADALSSARKIRNLISPT